MEDKKTAREGMRNILRRHPDLVGFYMIGSGELTIGTRHGLISKRLNAVLGHPVDALAAELVNSMTMRLTGQVGHVQNVLLPLQTHTPEAV
jgi:LacI family transcriptional regulator